MTVCFIPVHQQPIYRFLAGAGELSRSTGAFTLYEALLSFAGEDYPLQLGSVVMTRGDLLSWASYNLQGPYGGSFPRIEEARELIRPVLQITEIERLQQMLENVPPVPANVAGLHVG